MFGSIPNGADPMVVWFFISTIILIPWPCISLQSGLNVFFVTSVAYVAAWFIVFSRPSSLSEPRQNLTCMSCSSLPTYPNAFHALSTSYALSSIAIRLNSLANVNSNRACSTIHILHQCRRVNSTVVPQRSMACVLRYMCVPFHGA